MAVKLSFDEYKWLLKCYWKVENVVQVKRRWMVEFGTPPQKRVTLTRIRDNFEVDGTVKEMSKVRCGRKRRGSATEFPPLFSDLNPLDFYFWETLENSVYATEPQTLEGLRE